LESEKKQPAVIGGEERRRQNKDPVKYFIQEMN